MSAKASETRRTRNGWRAAPPAYPPAGQAGLETVKRRLLRLALDVHDGPMQNLAVIGFSLGDLRRRMKAVVPAEHQMKIDDGMAQITEELGKVESELRALIGALEEDVAQTIPLREAIESEVRDFERRSETAVELTIDGSVRVETDSQRIALQSVTRAALANVAKHAKAEHVTVHLWGSHDTVTLEVSDDGRGFRTDAPPKPRRFGLTGMRERIELLGGEFRVSSRPGGPTTITATLETWRPSPEQN